MEVAVETQRLCGFDNHQMSLANSKHSFMPLVVDKQPLSRPYPTLLTHKEILAWIFPRFFVNDSNPPLHARACYLKINPPFSPSLDPIYFLRSYGKEL